MQKSKFKNVFLIDQNHFKKKEKKKNLKLFFVSCLESFLEGH